jgi:LysM repeat protein
VTYLVKKGDTLGGIAYTYGISVEVLEAANPSAQPAFLSIGAVLTIPVVLDSGAFNVVAAASPTPMPLTLTAGPACYRQVTGALYCLVEARNPGPAPLDNVSAQIALIGPKGEVLASEITYSALDLILPGNGAPLAAWFPSSPSGMVAPVAQAVSAEPAPAGALPAISLDISSPQMAPAEGQAGLWTVTGQVRNGSALAVSSVRLVLTLYDHKKQIVGYRQEDLPGGLAAGASLGFSLSAASLGGPAESYAVVAEGAR